jgi:hypothetical protein
MGPAGPTGATGPAGTNGFLPAYGSAYVPPPQINLHPNEAVPFSRMTYKKGIKANKDHSLLIEQTGIYYVQYTINLDDCSPDSAFCAYMDNLQISESITARSATCGASAYSCGFMTSAYCNSTLKVVNSGFYSVKLGGDYLQKDQPAAVLSLWRIA